MNGLKTPIAALFVSQWVSLCFIVANHPIVPLNHYWRALKAGLDIFVMLAIHMQPQTILECDYMLFLVRTIHFVLLFSVSNFAVLLFSIGLFNASENLNIIRPF